MTTIQKNLALIFILFCSNLSFSQISVEGKVVDRSINEGLGFCHLVIQNTSNVSLTNEEGYFKINAQSLQDSLIISFIGYQTKTIAIKDIPTNKVIDIQPSNIQFSELVVVAEDDFLYKIIEKCRKQLKKTKRFSAKTYLQVETMSKDQPLEMIQAYYNGYLYGSTVSELFLKNGRVGLAEVDSSTFINLGTTQALAKLNLVEKSKKYPFNPLQYKGRKLRKRFAVKRVRSYSDQEVIHIAFEPKNSNFQKEEYFEGEVWIHQATGALLKINLKKENVQNHPFRPMHPSSKIDTINLDITEHFNFDGKKSQLSHINLDYDMIFLHHLPRGFQKMKLSAQSLLHFYDYNELFFIPYFEYDKSHHDYRKISIIPYNPVFWKHNQGIVLTEKEKAKLRFIEQKGILLNFEEDFYNKKPFFEHNNVSWSKDSRISVKSLPIKKPADAFDEEISVPDMSHYREINETPFDLSVQIFLDMNKVADTLHYSSETILDIFSTYFNLAQTDTANCLVNIYFDLCEIEHRKMKMELKSRNFTSKDILKVYQKTLNRIDNMTVSFQRDMKKIERLRALKKWNDIVKKELKIDNMKLFNLQIKK